VIGEISTEINTSYGGNHLNRQYLDIKGNYYFSGLAEYNLKFDEKKTENRLTIGYNVFENDLKSTYRIFSGLRSVNKTILLL
jgi:hypothetical protein